MQTAQKARANFRLSRKVSVLEEVLKEEAFTLEALSLEETLKISATIPGADTVSWTTSFSFVVRCDWAKTEKQDYQDLELEHVALKEFFAMLPTSFKDTDLAFGSIQHFCKILPRKS